ncbi:uncharacterized protein LOC129550084 [Moschus berezovskii]|uniref:uncharacterized protein LOC129550084 n=1 Tax=Moschus berezovskii TaxID=68408 RepID=UPI002443B39B|nr:uncharacterized protein LOC129550084 [Moschus berezovskii]
METGEDAEILPRKYTGGPHNADLRGSPIVPGRTGPAFTGCSSCAAPSPSPRRLRPEIPGLISTHPSFSRIAQTSHPTRLPEMRPAQPREQTLRSRRVSQARRAASTSANRSSLGASLPRVPLREEVRAPVNAPAPRGGEGGQTRATRGDPRRAGAEQTPGGGRRRAPGMRISRHRGLGAPGQQRTLRKSSLEFGEDSFSGEGCQARVTFFYLRYQRQSVQLDKLCRRLPIGKPVSANLGDQTDSLWSTNPTPGSLGPPRSPGRQEWGKGAPEGKPQAGLNPPEITLLICGPNRPPPPSSCRIAAPREPLGPGSHRAPALLLRRGSADHRGRRARPGISAHAAVHCLAKMSAKPSVGFVNEASRQILAGGSAGKAAPPGRALVAFPFACSENLSPTSLPTRGFAFFLCLPRSGFRARGARE